MSFSSLLSMVCSENSISTQIPSIDKCLSFYDHFGMYDNIRAHSKQVARACLALYDGLLAQGHCQALSPRELVCAAALLHDIAKAKCLVEDCRHAEVGRAICEDLGYPEIADAVGQHVILSSYNEDDYRAGRFNLAAIVYYGDKRVRHEEIVDLDARLEYIIKVYGKDDAATIAHIRKNFSRCQSLETYLFHYTDFPATDLAHKVSELKDVF